MALPEPEKIKALFLDFDGTLVDSMPLLYSVYSQFLAAHGKEGSRGEFDLLSGPTLAEVIARLKESHSLEEEEKLLFEEYMELLYSHYTQNLELFAGVRTFLNYVEQLAIPMVLVTSASRSLATAFLEAEGILPVFSHLITGESVPAGKPDPAIYLRALFLAEVSPSQALTIEDSEKGLEAAAAAGIYALHITHDGEKIVGIGNETSTPVSDWHAALSLFKSWYG